jgi:hypothetical protein
MWKYIKFSNIKLSIDLNPFCWGFMWHFQGPTQTDPHLRIQYVRILGLSLAVIIDNGVYHTWEEEIIPTETKADVL